MNVEAQEQNFVDDFVARWHNAQAYTLQMAALMPEEQYSFRPSPEEMTYGEQLLHLSRNIIYLSGTYLSPGDSLQKEALLKAAQSAQTKAEIAEVLNQAFNFVHHLLGKYPLAQLDAEVDFFAGRMRQRRVFFLLIDHLAHHRGQLAVYLRLKGFKPPRYVGW
ncbi:MAG: DinB family protein [Microscillaceae bacterium]|nr:DinB family protein [Microscillaceae bacterium]